jgi:hypothetical protein
VPSKLAFAPSVSEVPVEEYSKVQLETELHIAGRRRTVDRGVRVAGGIHIRVVQIDDVPSL